MYDTVHRIAHLAALMTALALTVTPLSANAEGDQTEKATARFHALDKDKDDALSLKEFKSDSTTDVEKEKKRDTRFKRLDVNEDGKLSLSEFLAGSKTPKKKAGGDD